MLEDAEFRLAARKKLIETLKSNPPQVVVIVKHASTNVLRDLLDEAYLEVPFLPRAPTVEDDGTPFSGAQADLIGAADRILVIDDAVVTAATVIRLRSRIYTANQRHQKNATVSLFTVLERPSHSHVYRTIRNCYAGSTGSTVHNAEQLLLPREGRANCPWCRELEALRLWASKLKVSETYARRQEDLTGPLSSPILMGDSDEQARLRTEEAFWGTLDEVTAFAAVSSATTEIRAKLDEPQTDFVEQYAGLRLVFDAYYDQSIRAAALRALEPRHIRHVQQDPMFSEWLARFDQGNCTPGLLAELAYAAAVTRIPHGPVLELLDRCNDGSDHHATLRRIVEIGTGIDSEASVSFPDRPTESVGGDSAFPEGEVVSSADTAVDRPDEVVDERADLQ